MIALLNLLLTIIVFDDERRHREWERKQKGGE